MSKVIIVTGLPCAGKSTIANQIVEKFQLVCISKDEIKETLFDSLGWSDREWSRKVGMAAIALMDALAIKHFSAKQTFIMESNFKPKFYNLKLRTWQKEYGLEIMQILCFADGKILFERFKSRSESSQRHPGHIDTKNYAEFKSELLVGKAEPLDVRSNIVELDTTNFNGVNTFELFAEIKTFLEKA